MKMDVEEHKNTLVLNGHTLSEKQAATLLAAVEQMRDSGDAKGGGLLDHYRMAACELIALIHSPGKKKKKSDIVDLCETLSFLALVAYLATLYAHRNG
jgi:hypothetical protein